MYRIDTRALMALAVSTTMGCAELTDLAEWPPEPPLGQQQPGEAPTAPLAAGEIVLADELRTYDGITVRWQKVESADGITALALGLDGTPIDPETLPRTDPSVIDARLRAQIAAMDAATSAEDTLPVVLALVDAPDPDRSAPSSFGGHSLTDDGYTAHLEGAPLTLLEEGVLRARRQVAISEARRARSAWRAAQWQALADRHGLSSARLSAATAEGRRLVELELTAAQIEAVAAESADLIAAIEPARESRDELAAALGDVSVDPTVFADVQRQGGGVGIFQSEIGCAPDGTFDDYDRLSGGDRDHARRVASVLRTVSPLAFIYCRGGSAPARDSDLDGVGGNPAVLVENHSHGRDTDEDYSVYDRDADDHVYENGVLVVKSAGNDGDEDDPYVSSPGKGLNVLTVGAYDDATAEIAPFSSWWDGETGNDKPEVSAPGVELVIPDYEHHGARSGTSYAAPIVSGMAADMMGAYGWLQHRPHYSRAYFLSGATDAIEGGEAAVGAGGVDFRRMYFNGTGSWWDGRNDSFSRYDARDSLPNNGYIDRFFDVDAGRFDRVRVSLSWLTRGSYTHAHRNDAHPIGRDLDIAVFDPNGDRIGGSASWDNPYEVADFPVVQSGRYRVRISEFANRDAGLRLKMGLSIKYY